MATELSLDDYLKGILDSDRVVLARAITLIESNAPRHQALAKALLRAALPHSGRALRIGITGVPGAGKSSFIEAFGCYLCEHGERVAVLAVDPSSQRSKGSILGDKTRMERLSQHEEAFIRPSPTGGTLGGVHRKTRETMLLCEAAGFTVVLVETVGVGQSEGAVRSMVDFFLLLMLTGGGDELQSIKRGVIELADAIAINKADGDNRDAAIRMSVEFNQALHYLGHGESDWAVEAYPCSAFTGEGIEETWRKVLEFQKTGLQTSSFQERRRKQLAQWVDSLVFDGLKARLFDFASVREMLKDLKQEVLSGSMPASTAACQVLGEFERMMLKGAKDDKKD